MVSGLSKTDFMLGLVCFIARRGLQAKIGSDNGIFVGARNDRFRIRALFDKDKTGSKANYVIATEYEWLTILPRAPRFGGLREAALKSMRRVVGLYQ